MTACICICQGGSTKTPNLYGQSSQQKSTALHAKYVLQPEADKLRRRLGSRFTVSGREDTILNGFLTVGMDRRHVQIVREQDLAGEKVVVHLAGNRSDIVWTGTTGALSSGLAVMDEDKAIIERIVLDSADQFIQAQMRGASYLTVGRSVRPETADPETYSGPTWDITIVTEPESAGNAAPLSRARVYYLNTATGLLDKVVSKENGETMVAEFSGWTNVNGELNPSRIQWSRNGKLIMEVTFNNIGHGSK
jgi:hypothetical protein